MHHFTNNIIEVIVFKVTLDLVDVFDIYEICGIGGSVSSFDRLGW